MPIHAPRLPTSVPWLNVERPLTQEELLGRLVILDFWTYCCINCLHTLPVLARLEARFSKEPVVFIGVHSPKFHNERDETMVREAVRRYGVTHPVIVDDGRRIWSEYAVKAWPTLVVVDPFGNVLGDAPGEPQLDVFDNMIRTILAGYRARDIGLATEPLPLRPEAGEAGALAYPTKLVAGRDRLYVSDAGHNQIVELEPRAQGPLREVRRFGTGRADHDDGFEPAFDHPQGLALDEGAGVLWVA
ncbi:MAG: thioredoxin-like domain-containing protein, partial [Myxococcales bacterium]